MAKVPIKDRAKSFVSAFNVRKYKWYSSDPSRAKRWLKNAGIGFGVFVLLYYPVGMIWFHTVDDDLDYARTIEVPSSDSGQSGSLAVAIAAALIDRETNENRWVANDPFFMPAAALDNMPNFQQGILGSLAQFTFELRDQLGRTRGSSQTDPDLAEAAGLLQIRGDRWIFDFNTSILPVSTSEAQYRQGRRALLTYNDRLAAGDAVFDRRADNLRATLDRIALDLGASSADIQEMVTDDSFALIDTEADDLFYRVKGNLYAYYLILQGLERDFADVLSSNTLEPIWLSLMTDMRIAAGLDPLLINNGNVDGLFPANHLAAQGFFLLRARTHLREITNILLI